MPMYDRLCANGHRQIDVFEPVQAENPPCAICGGDTQRAWLTRTSNVVGDECDFQTEHGWAKPMRFRSKAEWRRAQKEAGIEHAPRYAPLPGSDKVRAGGMSNWNAYADLSPEKLAWLAERLATGKAQKEPELPPLHVRQDVRYLTGDEVVELQKHV